LTDKAFLGCTDVFRCRYSTDIFALLKPQLKDIRPYKQME